MQNQSAPPPKKNKKGTEFVMRIHGQPWQIVFTDPMQSLPLREGENYGVTDRSKFIITVSNKETLQTQAITFFHEFFHASKTIVRYNQPPNPDVAEEVDSDLIAYALVEFMAQLKDFPAWFRKVIGK